MSIERQLYRTLADERFTVAAWPDPVQRVSAGVARRRQRRTVAVACAAALTAAFAGTTVLWWPGTSTPDMAAGDRVIPWLDSPVPRPTNLVRREPRAEAHDCHPTDLNPLAWMEGSVEAGSRRTYTVLLPNQSDSRCTLRGSAGLTAIDADTGQRLALAMEPLTESDPAAQHPATVDPGEPARIDLAVAGACPNPSGTARRLKDLAVVVLGREFLITELRATTACPLGIGSWYVLPPLLQVPFLVASIHAPERVQRGGMLEYVVTVLNAADRPYRLEPCPGYTQRLAGTAQTHRLNCAVAVVIPPHRALRFQMRLSVPEDTPAGRATLTWMASTADGLVVTADLARGGVTVQVVG